MSPQISPARKPVVTAIKIAGHSGSVRASVSFRYVAVELEGR